jgi:Pectate lyase superfamily protein
MNTIFLKIWKFFILAGLTIALVLVGYNWYASDSFQQSQISTNCGSSSGGETDNPIATRYGNSVYAWTDEIQWQCVYNIQDFSGDTTIDRFKAARNAAAANGGGVVYFPAGTYEFTDSIALTHGVVIRGATPSVADARQDDYNPPTNLIFSKYTPHFSGNGTPNETAFKKISTIAPDLDSNIGLVNLEIDRALISLVGNLEAGKQKNRIVFGVRNNNVAQPEEKVPDLEFQAPWMRYSSRFAANLKVNAIENILVANNRINDAITDNYAQPGYQVKSVDGKSVITYVEGDRVPFSYTNHYGIVVNRAGKFNQAATPETEPGLFRSGVTIRDNWVYHTMRVAISASGEGLVIRDNQIQDEPDKQWWTNPNGTREAKPSVTLENRAIDWSGWNVTIEENQYEVYRHQIRDTKYLSVDGEGILIQECCGGTTVNGAKISKNTGNSYIALYKVQNIQNVEISENTVSENISNEAAILVIADTNQQPYSMENVSIEGNFLDGGIVAIARAGGNGNTIENNRGTDRGKLKHSCHVTVINNTGFQQQGCLETRSVES